MKRVFEQVQNLLMGIEKDKHLHFECSFMIAYIIAWICKELGMNQWDTAFTAAGGAFAIGILKEVLIDFIIRGEQVDAKDLAADLAGSLLGAIICA